MVPVARAQGSAIVVRDAVDLEPRVLPPTMEATVGEDVPVVPVRRPRVGVRSIGVRDLTRIGRIGEVDDRRSALVVAADGGQVAEEVGARSIARLLE